MSILLKIAPHVARYMNASNVHLTHNLHFTNVWMPHHVISLLSGIIKSSYVSVNLNNAFKY